MTTKPTPPSDLISSLPLMKRMWRDWISPYKKLIAINLVLILGVSASTTAYPLIISWAIDRFEAGILDELAFLPLIVVAVTCVKGVTLYAHVSLTNKVASFVLRDLQNAVFAAQHF